MENDKKKTTTRTTKTTTTKATTKKELPPRATTKKNTPELPPRATTKKSLPARRKATGITVADLDTRITAIDKKLDKLEKAQLEDRKFMKALADICLAKLDDTHNALADLGDKVQQSYEDIVDKIHETTKGWGSSFVVALIGLWLCAALVAVLVLMKFAGYAFAPALLGGLGIGGFIACIAVLIKNA